MPTKQKDEGDMIPNKEQAGEAVEILLRGAKVDKDMDGFTVMQLTPEQWEATKFSLTILQLYHDNKLVPPMEVSEIEKIIKPLLDEHEFQDGYSYIACAIDDTEKASKDIALALHSSIGTQMPMSAKDLCKTCRWKVWQKNGDCRPCPSYQKADAILNTPAVKDKCPYCLGTGKFFGGADKNPDPIPCSKCNGTGKVTT